MKRPHLAAAALTLIGCGGPRLPAELHFEGLTMKKAAQWKVEGVQSEVFVPEGESMDRASLQIGVLTSTEHGTSRELNVWLMRQYRLSQVARAFESVAFDTACKIGTVANREFVAIHVCRDGSGLSVCVEADARLTPDMKSPTGVHGVDWAGLCATQWEAHGATLEALAERVVAQR